MFDNFQREGHGRFDTHSVREDPYLVHTRKNVLYMKR